MRTVAPGFAILLLLGACVSVSKLTAPVIVLPPPAHEARSLLQPLTGVVVERQDWGKLPPAPAPQGTLVNPGFLEAMGAGCAGAAATPASLMALPTLPLTCAAGAAGGSITAAISGASAAKQAHSPAETEAARTALAKAVASINPAGDLAEQLLAQGNRMEIPTLLSCAPASACVASDGSQPSAMLRLVVQPALVSAGAYNPEVTIYLTAKGRLLDAAGHEHIWRCWRYRSPAVSYFALAANDGARLRTEMDWAWKTLAGRIVDDVFLNSAEVTLAPDGFPGEAFALSGTGEHIESGARAERGTMQAVLEASDRPPASDGNLDCLGP